MNIAFAWFVKKGYDEENVIVRMRSSLRKKTLLFDNEIKNGEDLNYTLFFVFSSHLLFSIALVIHASSE